MSRWRKSLWWLWPLAPAVTAIYVLINLGSTQIGCPPYTTPQPPASAVCLPTLWPNLTGPDLVPVALSWLAVGAGVYLVLLAATMLLRKRRAG